MVAGFRIDLSIKYRLARELINNERRCGIISECERDAYVVSPGLQPSGSNVHWVFAVARENTLEYR